MLVSILSFSGTNMHGSSRPVDVVMARGCDQGAKSLEEHK